MWCVVKIMLSFSLMLVLVSVLSTTRCQAKQLIERVAFKESIEVDDTTFTAYLDCLEQLQERQANIIKNLHENLTLCQIAANKLKVSHANDMQKERDELMAASAELCARLDACEEHACDYDFFECHAKAGHTNMLLLTNMHVNASKALVDLEDRYSEAEKQRLQCYLEAKREYLIDVMTSQKELQICLKELKAREAIYAGDNRF